MGFTNNDKRTRDCRHPESQSCIKCSGEINKDAPGECRHPAGQKCVNCLGVTKHNMVDVDPQCNHPKGQKCPNCAVAAKVLVVGGYVKHESFDAHITNQLKKCTHKGSAKCHHCNFDFSFNFKIDLKCKAHAPWPAGSCGKCKPISLTLNRQNFRHVDHVSIMCYSDFNSFQSEWT